MKKASLVKESLLATIITLLITAAISLFAFKAEFVKPVRQGFLGFDIYDLYFSGKNIQPNYRDPNIILVQVANGRDAIANQINIIQKYSPAVIGIDVIFQRPGDPLKDDSLKDAISKKNNIVFAAEYMGDSGHHQPVMRGNFFDDPRYAVGITNFLGNSYSVIRTYPPYLSSSDSSWPAFTTSIIKKYSPDKYHILKARNNQQEIINYSQKMENYTSFSAEGLISADREKQLASILENKIVLLGFFVKDKPLVMEDLRFTPLNEEAAGKSLPDMYGMVIHANILSMILTKDYMKQAGSFVSYLVAGIISFLFLLYVLSRYQKYHHPNHGGLLLLQLLLILVLIYIFLVFFSLTKIKIDILPVMIALVVSVELLVVYKWFALWLNKKIHYQTVFNKTPHI